MGNTKDKTGYGCELASMVALWRDQWNNPDGKGRIVDLRVVLWL
jgi:hypothetical protein